MSPLPALAVLCGILLGVGLWSLAALVPRLGRPRLVHRVAPYLVDVSEEARELLVRHGTDPLPVFGSLFSPLSARLRGVLTALLGGTIVIESRLRQAGSELSVEAFRSRQLVWSVCGAATGVLISLALSRGQTLPMIVPPLLVALSGAGGFVLREQLLQRSARARISRMSAELPTTLEFLALSLSAGEGVLESFRRVARAGAGELAGELSGVVAAVNAGAPLGASLSGLADALRLPAFSRCVEQLVSALERGTPLAEVLHAQAQDSREEAKRRLLEVAGRKEVAMMVPLVFLILPVSVVFAVFPGVFVLQMGF